MSMRLFFFFHFENYITVSSSCAQLIPMGPEPVFAFHKLVQLKFVNETESWVGTWVLEFLHRVPNLKILHLALVGRFGLNIYGINHGRCK